MKFRMNVMPLEIIPYSETGYMAQFYLARHPLESTPGPYCARKDYANRKFQ
jgi:hypothetical protein